MHFSLGWVVPALCAVLTDCVSIYEKLGLAYQGEIRAPEVLFLVDET